MCERLSELREALRTYAESFDPACLDQAQAGAVVAEAVALEAAASYLRGSAGARLADTGAFKDAGERSGAHHLARLSGTSVASAVEALATAKTMGELPELEVVARQGKLSSAQLAVVADAAKVDPTALSRLLSKARKTSLAELREEAARIKAQADPDPEARRRRIHAGRFLRDYVDAEGAWNMRVRNNPEVGAQIKAALAPVTDRIFRAARKEGRREAVEAYAADALTELVTTELAASEAGTEATSDATVPQRRPRLTSAKVIFRLDLECWLRGYVLPGETCEIAGFGPVAVSVIQDVIAKDNPFLAAVLTKAEAVAGVAHLGRRPTAKQRTALEWMYPSCGVGSCTTVARLEADHRIDWAKSHLTVLEALDLLCDHHHWLKTHRGWSLVEGTGKRDFVPPDDPRHPRNKPPPGEQQNDEEQDQQPDDVEPDDEEPDGEETDDEEPRDGSGEAA
ncbi:MAG: DUF222 domain-containing protein [Actinobacteria bacterium]|nr:MAG: DUF222 domain-containing protein [Actinomycetota bacterium]